MNKLLLILIIPLLSFGQERVLWTELTNVNSDLEIPLKYYKGVLFTGIEYSLHENGEIWGEVTYNNGTPNGAVKSFYDNGQIQYLAYLTNGFCTHLSTEKTWYESGELNSVGTYNNPNEDLNFSGVFTFYYKNGKLKAEHNYKDGKIKSETCWSQEGLKIKCK